MLATQTSMSVALHVRAMDQCRCSSEAAIQEYRDRVHHPYLYDASISPIALTHIGIMSTLFDISHHRRLRFQWPDYCQTQTLCKLHVAHTLPTMVPILLTPDYHTTHSVACVLHVCRYTPMYR